VNEYNIDWSSGQVPDFKFNGKELDEESGMYYFEARYQSPPVFISRDPLFEARPYMSPYAYCSNSPVNRIDHTGLYDTEKQANKARDKAVKQMDKIYGKGAGAERVSDVKYNSKTKQYSFSVYTHNEKSNNIEGGIRPATTSVSNRKENQRAADLAKYSTLSGNAQYEQGLLMNARNASGLESFRNYDAYFFNAIINEKKAIKVGGDILQGIALFNPIIGTVNTGLTIGKGEDIYGNKANSIDLTAGWLDILFNVATFVPGPVGLIGKVGAYTTTTYSAARAVYNETQKDEKKK
jgi:RHS repeat-associated protein